MGPVENPEGPNRKIQRSKISKYRAPKSPVRRVLLHCVQYRLAGSRKMKI
jgi:hypothetical protein